MNHITVDGINIPVKEKEIIDCNILEVKAGTTGHRGGDSGHGGRTILHLKDLGSTDMRLNFLSQPLENSKVRFIPGGRVAGKNMEAESIEIVFGGDSELESFLKALRFAVMTLEEQINATRKSATHE